MTLLLQMLMICLAELATRCKAAPIIFAATITATSSLARAVYSLLGIQPDLFFTDQQG